jgi:diguanylate cyclase (GGDEF)-like protein
MLVATERPGERGGNEPPEARRATVVVVEDDDDMRRMIELNLRPGGFEVVTAPDGETALDLIRRVEPDLVLLDIMMPRMDGLEVCERMREEVATRYVPVIFLSAKSRLEDRVAGLTVGGDDYLTKPFDPIELLARVSAAIKRSKRLRGLNPLTQLPGNTEVEEAVYERVANGSDFALLHIDVDEFKAFNDYYGFLRGDRAIRLLAECSRDALTAETRTPHFLGHLGGDDFIAVVDAEVAETVAKGIAQCWDERIQSLYDPADLERGYIEIRNRRRDVCRYSPMTISIGIATTASHPFSSHRRASEIATEMKQVAKNQPGSTYAVDRRTSE